MTIHFKNGMRKKISQEMLKTIVAEMSKGKGMTFQVFSDPKTGAYLMLNMNEVVLID